MQIWTACKETGDFIEKFDTIEEAKDAIMKYEESDRKDGTYEEGFYDVVDEEHCTICTD